MVRAEGSGEVRAEGRGEVRAEGRLDLQKPVLEYWLAAEPDIFENQKPPWVKSQSAILDIQFLK